jgi:hypothetical protein
MTDERLPTMFTDGVWHVTKGERFSSMLESGFILSEPDISNRDRWGTSAGPDFYPFARHLRGCSLFDFRNLDPVAHEEAYPNSRWRAFVPCPRDWHEAIWIKFPVEVLGASLMLPAQAVERWKANNALCRKYMPGIEAIHVGPLALSLASSIWRYADSSWSRVDAGFASQESSRACD